MFEKDPVRSGKKSDPSPNRICADCFNRPLEKEGRKLKMSRPTAE
jgi:hypothetical protein